MLCVTHLPQVAAQADQQLRVSKHVAAGTTRTRIEALDDAARVEELARMLGGATITARTRDHALRDAGGGRAPARGGHRLTPGAAGGTGTPPAHAAAVQGQRVIGDLEA